MKIAIIVPVYNEGQRAIETIEKILKVSCNNIIVIDDGSVKKSYLLVKKQFEKNDRVKVLRHIINLGKGAAMKTGAEKAWKMGSDAVVFIDADGQHDPKFLPQFEKTLIKTPIVFGYRSLDKKMPWIRRNGNIIAKKIIKHIFNLNRQDILCGFLGFQKEVYKDIYWESPRYAIETEMAISVGKKQIPFSEIKIDTIYVDKYKGVSIFDALKIFTKLPYWYLTK